MDNPSIFFLRILLHNSYKFNNTDVIVNAHLISHLLQSLYVGPFTVQLDLALGIDLQMLPPLF